MEKFKLCYKVSKSIILYCIVVLLYSVNIFGCGSDDDNSVELYLFSSLDLSSIGANTKAHRAGT